ncbi:MAG: AbrB/MazE/SpoVT family DNA-binding domain-containing protein [bacterium]
MNAFVSTTAQKGQVTIPKDMRDHWQLVTGNKIEFIYNKQGEMMIKPRTRKVSDVTGFLSQYKKATPASIEEMNQAIAQHIQDHT